MKRYDLRAIGVCGFLATLASCGSSKTNEATLTQADFIDQYCVSVARCCTNLAISGRPESCSDLLQGLDGSFDPANSQNCLDDISKSESDPEWCVAYANPPRCNAALAALRGEKGNGTAKVGEACTSASDCSPVGEDAYVVCAEGGALSGPTVHECAEEDIIPAGASTTCVGDREYDAVGWLVFDGSSAGTTAAVCEGDFVIECDEGGACKNRLDQGFVAPGGSCDLEHACAYGTCPNDGGADVCPTHFAPDDGLRSLCGGPP